MGMRGSKESDRRTENSWRWSLPVAAQSPAGQLLLRCFLALHGFRPFWGMLTNHCFSSMRPFSSFNKCFISYYFRQGWLILHTTSDWIMERRHLAGRVSEDTVELWVNKTVWKQGHKNLRNHVALWRASHLTILHNTVERSFRTRRLTNRAGSDSDGI